MDEETDAPTRVTVDGELWEVKKSSGQYHFAWLTGIAKGYGFTTLFSDPNMILSPQVIESAIREFMSNVNPENGYLD